MSVIAAVRGTHRQRRAPDAVEIVQGGGDGARGRHETDLTDALDAIGRARLRYLDQHDIDRRDILRAEDAERSQRHVGGKSTVVAGEIFCQRVAEPHVDRALDLAFAQRRVDGPADIVGGKHTLDATARAIDDDELRGIPEGRVDDRMLYAVAQLVGPVDAELASVVDVDLTAVGQGGTARFGDRAGTHQRAP